MEIFRKPSFPPQATASSLRPPTGEKLILASASPRRREILRKYGIAFDVKPSPAEPLPTRYITPEAAARKSAEAKAIDVAKLNPGRLVLGADTIVAAAGQMFGKPANHDEAWQMLRTLSGICHHVYTGVALVRAEDGEVKIIASRMARTEVTFKVLTAEDIEWYIRSGEPFDKAGGYAIQGQGGNLIAGISGSYYNVVGLPIEMVLEMLHEAGWQLLPQVE